MPRLAQALLCTVEEQIRFPLCRARDPEGVDTELELEPSLDGRDFDRKTWTKFDCQLFCVPLGCTANLQYCGMIFGEHCTWQRDGDEDPKNRCQARRLSARASGLGGEAQCEELFGDVPWHCHRWTRALKECMDHQANDLSTA